MLIPLIFWVFILILVAPVYVLVLVPLGVWRLLVNLLAWLLRDDLEGSLDSRDLVFTGDDYYGKARKSMISSIILKGETSLEALERRFLHEVILPTSHLFRMRCRPHCFLGFWFWQRVDIKAKDHFSEENKIMSEDEFYKHLPLWVSDGFQKGTPLWNVKLVHLDNKRTALVVKLHHLIGDGVSFIRLLEELCDGGWSSLKSSPVRPFSAKHWAYAWYNFPWTAIKAYRLARIRKGFRPKAIGGPAYTSYTMFSMEKLKMVRRVHKCLFPTVLAAMLSGAFYKLFQSLGKKNIPSSIRTVMPTPWPNRPDKGMCNHVGWLHSELPLGDPEAIRNFEKSVRNSYKSGLHGIMWQIFRPMYLLPATALSWYTDWGEKNLPPAVLTSVPGSMTKATMLGLHVEHSHPTLSLGLTAGCTACMTTYADGGYFSIRVSKEIIPNQETLDLLVRKYLHEELDNLYHHALNRENANAISQVEIEVDS